MVGVLLLLLLGENESYSMSCVLSLPTVWDIWTDVYICGIFPSYDRRAGRKDTSLAQSNIVFSGRKCKAHINAAFQAS